MPFFFIVPLWLLCVAGGVVLCFFRSARFLASYAILCSTGGLLASFVLSTGLIWIGPQVFSGGGEWKGVIWIAAYLAGIAVGALLGMVAGFFAARQVNRWFQWSAPVTAH